MDSRPPQGHVPEPTILSDVVLLKKYRIAVKFLSSDDTTPRNSHDKIKAVFVETIGNPSTSSVRLVRWLRALVLWQDHFEEIVIPVESGVTVTVSSNPINNLW